MAANVTKNKQTPDIIFFTQRNKNGNTLIWKLSRQHDVIRKVVLLSNGFKENVAHSAHSKFSPWNELTADLKTVSKHLQAVVLLVKRIDYTMRIKHSAQYGVHFTRNSIRRMMTLKINRQFRRKGGRKGRDCEDGSDKDVGACLCWKEIIFVERGLNFSGYS